MRVLLFPGIPLPPQPVLTRWKTWFDAVNYYAEYYGKIMKVIYALDSTDSSAVAAVKSLPSEQLLEDILFIDSSFKIVSKSITLLESSKLQLSEALNIVYKSALKKLKGRIYKTVILPVVLYGCKTWTLTLREEHRLRVFENKVPRKIFGAKRDEVTGEWRKLHNTELHALYSSPDIIRNIKSRRLRWAGHVARMGESRNAYRVLVGRPEGKRPLGRPRRRWEDNIKMDLREVGCDDRDWIGLGQDRDQWRAYMRAAMNLRVKPSTRSRYFLAWSPNSPDLTPPDFFVWGFVKDIVYSPKNRKIDDLRVNITQTFQQNTPLMLQRTWAELHRRRERNSFVHRDLRYIVCHWDQLQAHKPHPRRTDVTAKHPDDQFRHPSKSVYHSPLKRSEIYTTLPVSSTVPLPSGWEWVPLLGHQLPRFTYPWRPAESVSSFGGCDLKTKEDNWNDEERMMREERKWRERVGLHTPDKVT
ncbi:hypothetical protein ANN_06363 [Periplaneta americana]|uniref:Uncharacterized protein n=1 Tax=Periplaneta americana TaxID=6978 RepID=A0ABQ8TDC0_PERAM|nr:hypothetical protein ANN_06363 [Periplaneta americana]